MKISFHKNLKIFLLTISLSLMSLISPKITELNFLSEESLLKNTDSFDSQILKHDPKNLHHFQKVLKGAIEGFPLFTNSTNDNECVTNFSFSNKVLNILIKFEKLKWNENDHLRDGLIDIVDDIVDHKDIFITEYKECEKLGKHMHPGLHKMKDFLLSPDYYDKFTMNLVGNLKKISDIGKRMKHFYHDGNYNALGNKIGELIRLVFFWDL